MPAVPDVNPPLSASRTAASRTAGPGPVRRRARRPLALALAAAAAAAGLVALPASPAAAQAPCVAVELSATTWATGPDAGGFAATIRLTNDCQSVVQGWTLALTFAPDHTLSHGWSANWSVAGSEVTATGLPWNSVLEPGQSTTIGFIGGYLGTYQDPLGCTLNGQSCDGGGEPGENQPPEVTLTSPDDGQNFIDSCAVPLAAEASDPDGSVDRVEFFVNDVLVATDDTSPYQFEVPGDHPVLTGFGPFVAHARAVDDGDPPLSAVSEPAAFSLLVPPPALMIVACSSQVTLDPGSSVVVNLRNFCSASPQVEVTVTGDAGISVSPTAFTLPSTGQDITITAEPWAAGATASIHATAQECLPAGIQVTVAGAG